MSAMLNCFLISREKIYMLVTKENRNIMAEVFFGANITFRKKYVVFLKFPNLYTLEIPASKLKDSVKNKTF